MTENNMNPTLVVDMYEEQATFFVNSINLKIVKVQKLDKERSAVEITFEKSPDQITISSKSLLDIIGELEDAQGIGWLEDKRTKIQYAINMLENILQIKGERK